MHQHAHVSSQAEAVAATPMSTVQHPLAPEAPGGTLGTQAPAMFDAFLTTDGLIALATLTFLEIVLGVDNVIFISILSGKLPTEQQRGARGSD